MDPESTPTDAPPEPLKMERNPSDEESGSNSSVSTTYFKKRSGSQSSSRSASVASTSRSPPGEQEGHPESWPSPVFASATKEGEVQKDEAEQPPEHNKAIPPKPEGEEKEGEKEEDIPKDAKEAAKDFGEKLEEMRTKETHGLKEGADKIVSEVLHQESIIIKETQQTFSSWQNCCNCCCSCCRNCGGPCGSCLGNAALVVCWPLGLISLLSCVCMRCPKLFATKAVKEIQARRQDDDDSRENAELESGTTEKEAKSNGKSSEKGHVHGKHHGHHHHEDKPVKRELSIETEGIKPLPGFTAPADHFFPHPDAEEDQPGR